MKTLEKGLKKADSCGVSCRGSTANTAEPFDLTPMEDRPTPTQRQGWGWSPLPCSHLLELCLARYLSLHFFFFPKGLQLGDSL